MIERIAGWTAQVSRATPAFFLLRGAVWALAVAALLVAGPADITLSPLAVWAVPVGLLPAVLPRTAAVTLWIFVVLAGWLAATMVYDEPVSYLRLVLLATLLYTTHVLAAVSAVIPFDAVVAPRTLLSWLPRTAALLALTALLALAAAALPELFGGARFLIASLVGFAVMAGLAYYLARLVNRA